jgi:recombinational DNA repair ATPase RecF
MRIVKLQAENVKRLVCVEIEPSGNLIVVGGKNGNGKTSLLDSIMMALAGKSAPDRRSRNCGGSWLKHSQTEE